MANSGMLGAGVEVGVAVAVGEIKEVCEGVGVDEISGLVVEEVEGVGEEEEVKGEGDGDGVGLGFGEGKLRLGIA